MIIETNKETDIDQLIMAWKANSETLKELKKIEMQQRKEIISRMFSDMKVGTNTVDLGGGYKLKTTHGFDHKLDEDALQLVLPEIEKLGEEAKIELYLAVKYKANLVKAGYDKMSEEVRAIFDEAVVTREKSPTLSLVEPKQD